MSFYRVRATAEQLVAQDGQRDFCSGIWIYSGERRGISVGVGCGEIRDKSGDAITEKVGHFSWIQEPSRG